MFLDYGLESLALIGYIFLEQFGDFTAQPHDGGKAARVSPELPAGHGPAP